MKAILMNTLNIPLFCRRSKRHPYYFYLSPNLAQLLTLSGSNYPYLEQIFMVPKMFEPLRFDCIVGPDQNLALILIKLKIINMCSVCVQFSVYIFMIK